MRDLYVIALGIQYGGTALGWTVEEVRDVKSAMPDATSHNQPLSSDADGSELGE